MDAIVFVAVAALALFGAVASIAGVESRDGFDEHRPVGLVGRAVLGGDDRMWQWMGVIALDIANEKARESQAAADRWWLLHANDGLEVHVRERRRPFPGAWRRACSAG